MRNFPRMRATSISGDDVIQPAYDVIGRRTLKSMDAWPANLMMVNADPSSKAGSVGHRSERQVAAAESSSVEIYLRWRHQLDWMKQVVYLYLFRNKEEGGLMPIKLIEKLTALIVCYETMYAIN